jgi:hypothetical protein
MLLPILVSILLGFVTTPIVSHWVALHNKNLLLSLVSSILIGLVTGIVMSKDITTITLCALAGSGGWLISYAAILWLLQYHPSDDSEDE